jgi:DNA adenine methylase
MRSPIIWFGGKYFMMRTLLPLVPVHRRYVEVFGGGASLLFHKEKSEIEVYNDIDKGLFHFFHTLRTQPQELVKYLELVPYSRNEYNYARATWEDEEDEVVKAGKWYTVLRQGFSADFGQSWGSNVTATGGGNSRMVNGWLNSIPRLLECAERFRTVQVENSDYKTILDRYDTKETFFYLDPPYLPETRRAGEYKHELTTQDHTELLEIIKEVKGKVLISGYPNPLYENSLKDWGTTTKQTVASSAGRTRNSGLQGEGKVLKHQGRVEQVWFNYKVGTEIPVTVPVSQKTLI